MFSRISGDERSSAAGPDGFVVDDGPHREYQLLFSHLLEEVLAQETYAGSDELSRRLIAQTLNRDPSELVEQAKAAAIRLAFNFSNRVHFGVPAGSPAHFRAIWVSRGLLRTLFSRLMRRKLPYAEPDILAILAAFGNLSRDGYWGIPVPSLLSRIERFVSANGLSDEMRRALFEFRAGMTDDYAQMRQLRQRVGDLLGEGPDELFEPGEPWADTLLADLKGMQAEQRRAWEQLLLHAGQLKGPAPSRRWRQKAIGRLEGIGKDCVKQMLSGWLAGLTEPANRRMPEKAGNVLRGLVWYAALLPGSDIAGILGAVALACYRKIPGIGARSTKVGNACLRALASRSELSAVSEIARIQQKIRYREVRRLAGSALEAAAERSGLPLEELEEIAVPDFGLGRDGKLLESLGEHTAEIVVSGSGRARLVWRNSRGKTLKSVPAGVRREHKAALTRLRKTTKEINSALGVQRRRVERLMIQERCWPYEVWKKRYIDQPLIGALARRLIWEFRQDGMVTLGIWSEDGPRDQLGNPIAESMDDLEIGLWHPLGSSTNEIQAWRLWLETRQIAQPFKQAHREVYLLTDAERTTGSYSNRFAAHILRQHQFVALCRERGWDYQLQGAWDSHNTPNIALPDWNLKAEFWVEAIAEGAFPEGGGIYPYVTTDQVRFRDPAGEALNLADVPALPLSEIFRDIDLFVGVCSVGNDPEWQDRGETGRFGQYWRDYSFGDLSATAQTRKEVLERLIPRLKVAGLTSVEGRFLVVRGDLHTYRIHLGSGNVLMEPGGRYLCIVPDRGAGLRGRASELFLPFEGDPLLSIILSKALMLANDRKIVDPKIVSQIRGG